MKIILIEDDEGSTLAFVNNTEKLTSVAYTCLEKETLGKLFMNDQKFLRDFQEMSLEVLAMNGIQFEPIPKEMLH